MNPWNQNHNNDIDNMTTYLSTTMFKMGIDPSAQASVEQYEDVNKTTAEKEAADGAASNGQKDEARDATNNADPPEKAAPEVKNETPAATAQSNPGSNPGLGATPSPAVPPGVPTADMTPSAVAPVSAPAQSTVALNEPTLEERGEISQLYVGRVIGKGGEVRMIGLRKFQLHVILVSNTIPFE